MGLSINTRNTFQVWGNTETVLYFAKDANQEAPSSWGASVAGAKRFAIRKDRLQTDSLLATCDITWRLPAANLLCVLGGSTPKVTDIVQDAAYVRWIVMIVEILSHGNSFRLHCRRNPKT